MLVTCPNCSTRYQVPDMVVGMKGRTMRCSNCQHQWKQPFVAAQPEAREKRLAPWMVTEPARATRPEAVMVGGGDAEIEDDLLAAAMRDEERGDAGGGEGGGGGANPFDRIAEMMMDQPPAPIPDVFASSAMEREPRRRGALGLVAIVVILVIAAVGVVLWFFQDQVVGMFPQAAKYYDKAGVHNEVLGAGLEFRDVGSERGTQDGHEVLIVRGVVANATKQARSVPPFWLVLYDGPTPLQSKVIDPPQDKLDAEGTVSFKVTLDQIDPHATRFEVTFAAPKKGEAKPAAAPPPAESAPAK